MTTLGATPSTTTFPAVAADVGADVAGAAATAASGAASALSTHAGAADPHTAYALEAALGTAAAANTGDFDAAGAASSAQSAAIAAAASDATTKANAAQAASWPATTAFDATAPTTAALGDAAAAGSAAKAAHRDHVHGMPALGTTAAAVGTSAGGSAATPSKSDHVHATGAGTPSTQAFGDAAATGSGPAAAMTDHKHAMPANPITGFVDTLNFVIDGGGSVITTGVKGDLMLHYAGTITEWEVLADQSGSIVVDIWKDTYANFPPTVADTITGAEKPTISAATKGQDTSLASGAGWAFSAGDILRFNVDSITSCQRVTIALKVVR